MSKIISPTATLSYDEIKNKLINYEQIDDTASLVHGNKIKYFEILDNGKYKFKLGGCVIVNKHPVYIVLTNGKTSWSVQLENHIIFREIDIDTVRLKYEEIIKKKDKQIAELVYLLKNKKK